MSEYVHLLFEVGAVELRRYCDESLEEGESFDDSFLAGLPLNVVIPKLVRTEFQTRTHHSTLV